MCVCLYIYDRYIIHVLLAVYCFLTIRKFSRHQVKAHSKTLIMSNATIIASTMLFSSCRVTICWRFSPGQESTWNEKKKYTQKNRPTKPVFSCASQKKSKCQVKSFFEPLWCVVFSWGFHIKLHFMQFSAHLLHLKFHAQLLFRFSLYQIQSSSSFWLMRLNARHLLDCTYCLMSFIFII